MIPEQKKCNACNIVKSASQFNKKTDKKYGVRLNYICKNCQSDKNKKLNLEKKHQIPIYMEFKICFTCKNEKNRIDFTKDCYSKDGLSASCINCNSNYYYQNKDKIIIGQKRYVELNKDIVEERKRKWAAKNPDKIKRANSEYYLRNKDARKSYNDSWRLQNPLSVRNCVQRRNVKKKGQTIQHFSLEQLKERLSVFDFLCSYCGGPFEHIDHLKPISKGGAHCLSNLRPSCANCNLKKAATCPFKWLEYIKKSKQK